MFAFIVLFEWSALPDPIDGVLILVTGYGMMHMLVTTCDRLDRLRARRNGKQVWW